LRLIDNERKKMLFRYDLGKRLKARDFDSMIVMKLFRFGPALWRLIIYDEPYYSALVALVSRWKSSVFVR